ncbi:endonuclease/exonuclease/phosphatase family protein [Pseudonocardia humida]|uniref:Endonuclease/exonuclease/phosphatase family protein n=1 Tax=Pseudonocardia humida TaxID=2800819 RepID=A0ABT0ZYK2_9PSEU|nr:endonuclease/exonuclease/phosphatase family protein [Pseudonocardia humida]MCO1655822.1 endonuclease/exonuclease/phosphatase family protein [Pseudonocardia humida]
MRIATWNLLHCRDVRTGRVDLGAVADAIAALDVDAVAVQEIDRELSRSGGHDQLSVLADKLGWHGVFAPALLGEPVRSWDALPDDGADPGGPAYGIGLLSPHPLHDVARLALPGGAAQRRTPAGVDRPPAWDREPRVAVRARLELPGGREVVLTGTHLTYVTWRAVRQLHRALSWAAAGGPAAVLAGDLNLPHRALRAALRGTGWRPTAPAGPTYPAWRPRMQLDHLLARGAHLDDVRVAHRGPSDHLAVTARVNMSGNQPPVSASEHP